MWQKIDRLNWCDRQGVKRPLKNFHEIFGLNLLRHKSNITCTLLDWNGNPAQLGCGELHCHYIGKIFLDFWGLIVYACLWFYEDILLSNWCWFSLSIGSELSFIADLMHVLNEKLNFKNITRIGCARPTRTRTKFYYHDHGNSWHPNYRRRPQRYLCGLPPVPKQ